MFFGPSRQIVIDTAGKVAGFVSSDKQDISLMKEIGNEVTDIENQTPLSNPPSVIKGLYLTRWSAGSPKKVESILDLTKKTGLNAVVIDIKDYSGHLAYKMNLQGYMGGGISDEIAILKPNTLIKRFHDAGIYVIGRISVFQDVALSEAHPELALQNKTTGKTWFDGKNLSWLDPAARPVWDYIVAITEDALSRGFDEVNFDYVRFASDGKLSDIKYQFWDETTPRHIVIKEFFQHLRQKLGEKAVLSADLFGLTTVDSTDLGIGQLIEDAYEYFDVVSPMVYPSHYAAGFLGYKNPALYPYEVIKYSMEKALIRLLANGKEQIANSSSSVGKPSELLAISHLPFAAKLRPWLQVFNLGAVYNSAMIHKEIQAVEDVFSSSTNQFAGWLLWDPTNNYAAL